MPIAGLIGNVLGGIFDTSNTQQANTTNIRLAREQMKWQENMWNLQNEYNAPIQQMNRLTQAGINPRSLSKSVQANVGNATTLPSYQRATVSAPNVGGYFANTADTLLKAKQGRLYDEQGNLVRADTLLRGKQADLAEAQKDTEKARAGLYGAQAFLATEQGNKAKAEIGEINKRVGLISAQIKTEGKRAKLFDEQAMAVKYDNELKKAQKEYKEFELRMSKLGIGPNTEQYYWSIAAEMLNQGYTDQEVIDELSMWATIFKWTEVGLETVDTITGVISVGKQLRQFFKTGKPVKGFVPEQGNTIKGFQ